MGAGFMRHVAGLRVFTWCLAFLLAYNFALSGHPLRMAYLVWDPNLSFDAMSHNKIVER
jgi:hypothetical protein